MLVLALALPAATRAQTYGQAEVGAAAQAAGFGHLVNRIAATAKPTVLVGRKLLRRTPPVLGMSRLGGDPDLPVGSRWPRCGPRTQTFLGQIRLSELPPEASELAPCSWPSTPIRAG